MMKTKCIKWLLSGTGCNISKYIPTRNHSSRMRTTGLPTVIHCIPGPMSRIWVPPLPLDIPTTPRYTPSNTQPPPRKDLLPKIPHEGTWYQRYPPPKGTGTWDTSQKGLGTRDINPPTQPRKDMRPEIPPWTEWLTGTCENITFLYLRWCAVTRESRRKLELNFWLEECIPGMILEALSETVISRNLIRYEYL